MSAELIHQMYIAYYQRPADPAGLIYWQDQLNANGGGEAGWNAVAAAFANASESSSLYGSQTLGQKISAIYLAAFERAASADEVAYWEASGFNAAQIGFAIVNGAQNDDLSTVTKKVDYAEEFVKALDPAGTGIGPFEFQYVDPSLGRTLMDPITKDSDVSAATVASQVTSTLPTLVTVNLTSGADTVVPTANAAEEINAALGGTSPSLGRTDTIDGGSAQDTINVAMDGNFLLGFSSGTLKDVEIVNLAATASSVTPKTFNFTGASGVETINVGAANAPIIISNISDTGVTVNLSGQATGSFDVGYKSGTISGTGSSMTIGVTEVGSDGNNVSLTSDGITDLTVVSNGSGNYIDLSGSVNDLTALSAAGQGDLYIGGITTTLSGFTAASLGGDLTLTVDTDTNSVLLASGQTITGGAGHDALRLQGSSIATGTTSSFEELIFDGDVSETIVRATGMAGLTTLTFSGQGSNAPSISGLGETAITVNAILNKSTDPQQTVVSSEGAVTVNLNAEPVQVGLGSITQNNFAFKASTSGAININVGAYVSASATYVLNDTSQDLGITVDSTSKLASTIRASGASTITVAGSGAIAATISGQNTQTINVNASSGSLAVGSSAASTFNLNVTDKITIDGTASRLSGLTTLIVDTGKGTADLSGANLGFHDIASVTLGGAGTGSTVLLNNLSASGNNITLTMTGLTGGVSAAAITVTSGDLVISAPSMSGSMDFTDLDANAITVQSGTKGNFSAAAVDSTGTFILDGTAHTSGSGSIAFGALSSSGAITISAGSGSGDITLLDVDGDSTVTLDASSFGGSIDATTFTANGNTTVSIGSSGDFSAGNADTAGTFTLDGSNATTASITFTNLSAGSNFTVSVGTGSGQIVMTSAETGGNFTLDASNSEATIDIGQATASGAVVVSLGTAGDFSAGEVISGGAFTLDGSNSTTADITLKNVSAAGNVTVSAGSGSGDIVATKVVTNGGFTIDTSTFGGKVVLTGVTASGAAIVSVGPGGEVSAVSVATQGAFTLDAAAATTGVVTLAGISAGGNLTMSMGTGTGDLVLTSGVSMGNITIDASTFGGNIDISNISASGAIVASLGAKGDFSAAIIDTTGAVTVDGAAATTASATFGAVSADGAITISMGSGSGGTLSTTGNIDTQGAFTLDTTNLEGAVDMASLTASGAATLSIGSNGDYSAGLIEVATTYTLDGSRATTGLITLTGISAGGNVSVSGGKGSGELVMTSAFTKGSLTIDAASFSGSTQISNISASAAVTISLLGGDMKAFSASIIETEGALTYSQATATSGAATFQHISAGGAVSVALGDGTGKANVSLSAVVSESTFSLTGAQMSDITIAEKINASAGITINHTGSGSLTASTLDTKGTLSITKTIGSGEGVSLAHVSGAAVSITVSGSGLVTAVAIDSNAFTFDASASTQAQDQHILDIISASGAATITLGTNNGLAVSAIAASAGLSITKGTGSADVTVATTVSAENGLITLNGGGSGTMVFSSLEGAGGLTFDGTYMSKGAYFSAEIVTMTSGNVAFTYGNGLNANVDVSAIDTTSGMSITGANLSVGEIQLAHVSATESVNMNLGGMSGSAVITAIDTDGVFTFNAGGAQNLMMDIETVSASAANITLGTVQSSSFANGISSANVNGTLTLDGTNYREIFTANDLSASGMTISFGDLSDALTVSVMTTNTFTFAGGNGANFSATITDATIKDTFSITMPELGNGLTIGNMKFSASGTVVMTNEVDAVTATTIFTAGEAATLDVNLGDDSAADVFALLHGSGGDLAGKALVKITNFSTGTDKLRTNVAGAAASAAATAIGLTTAAGMIGGALGTSLSASDLASGNATALFTYNGDTFFVGQTAENSLANTSFDDGEVVFQFVGVTDIAANDIIST